MRTKVAIRVYSQDDINMFGALLDGQGFENQFSGREYADNFFYIWLGAYNHMPKAYILSSHSGFDFNVEDGTIDDRVKAIQDFIEEVEDNIIIKNIDGESFTAGYDVGYVIFGCARIHISIFRNLNNVHNDLFRPNMGVFKYVETVIIGKGVFSMEDIKRIVAKFDK